MSLVIIRCFNLSVDFDFSTVLSIAHLIIIEIYGMTITLLASSLDIFLCHKPKNGMLNSLAQNISKYAKHFSNKVLEIESF